MGKDATVNYSMYLCLVMATIRDSDSTQQTPADAQLNDVLEPALLRLRRLLQDFVTQPANVSAAFDLERQIQATLRELGRAGVEWALNRVEPGQSDHLPPHVEFEAGVYTRIKRKTPQSVATLFGKIDFWRYGYRPTQKTGDATIFPLAQQLGIIAGATPALAERAAYYQAEAGATQRRTLQRLKQEHGVSWGVKKLREVATRISSAMAEERHAVQVEKLLQLLEQAWLSTECGPRRHHRGATDPQGHDLRGGQYRHGRGAGSSWEAVGNGLPGVYARVETGNDEPRTHAFGGRGVASLGTPPAASVLRDGCGRQRDEVL